MKSDTSITWEAFLAGWRAQEAYSGQEWSEHRVRVEFGKWGRDTPLAIPSSGLMDAVRDLASEMPSGDPVAARLHLLLVAMVKEIGRVDNELSSLAEALLGDRTYSITGGLTDDHIDHADPGPDGASPGSTRPATIADRHARI